MNPVTATIWIWGIIGFMFWIAKLTDPDVKTSIRWHIATIVLLGPMGVAVYFFLVIPYYLIQGLIAFGKS
jgi:hypothetical protein